MRIAVIAAVAAAMLAAPPAAFAKGIRLIATVGESEGSAISLTNVTGERVTDVPAGVYLIEVHDHSPVHNFHLIGPDVNKATEAGFVGTVVWVVAFRWKEQYRYLCDQHAGQMRGDFTTDGGPPFIATVGPRNTISLRTASGQTVGHLTAGRYWIVVRDRSARHNFHLRGPGVNRRTSLGFRGETTWILTLRRGRYRFVCDAHAAHMRGSVSVT